MAGIELLKVEKRFGEAVALCATDLTIDDGSLVAILGPSGCGKTTMLRLVAGLERPSGGRIRIGGSDVTALPPERRALGMMFQSYALLPHMSVQENLRFPLRMQGIGTPSEQADQVADALDLMQLGGLASRYPRQLSGGQQQRVALARALIARPRVVLLDEPLSNLDAQLRKDMQLELIELHRKLRLTTLLVTHDQEEALSLADVVVLMRDGRIEQIDSPRDIYRRPGTAFAAQFIGAANLLQVQVRQTANDGWIAELDDHLSVEISAPRTEVTGRCTLVVRQEDVFLAMETHEARTLRGTLGTVAFQGSTCRAVVHLAGQTLHVIAPPAALADAEPGNPIWVGWPRDAATVLPTSGENP